MGIRISHSNDSFYCLQLSDSVNCPSKWRFEKEIESVEPVVILRLVPRQLATDELAGFEGKVVWSSDGVIGIQSAAEEHHRVAKLIASGLNKLPT